MDARRDALAHRFIASIVDETREWPATLKITLHELAFVALPEFVLALDADAARAWARSWHERITAPANPIGDADWVALLAEHWVGSSQIAIDATPPSPAEIARLADLLARFGSLALALPWRDESARA